MEKSPDHDPAPPEEGPIPKLALMATAAIIIERVEAH